MNMEEGVERGEVLRILSRAFMVIGGVAFVPFALAFFTYELTGFSQPVQRQFGFAAGAFLLTMVGWLGFLAYANTEQWRSISREVHYVVVHGVHAWIFAALVGATAFCIYLMFPKDLASTLAERIASAFALYVGTVGAVVGVHTLYDRSAPISDPLLLCSYLNNDLRRYARHARSIYFVFPALNIAYYRAASQFPRGFHSIPDDHPYSEFARVLVTLKPAGPVTAVTYPVELYRPLFEAYARGADETPSAEAEHEALAERCASEAIRLVETAKSSFGLQHVQVVPSRFPTPAIVIGPVCYLISTWGMPRIADDGAALTTSSHPASLLIYRREDAVLAAHIQHDIAMELAAIAKREGSVLVLSGRDTPPPQPLASELFQLGARGVASATIAPEATDVTLPTPSEEPAPSKPSPEPA